MAYNNEFFYDRDNSVDNKYKYIYDFSLNFDPVYYLQIYPDIAGNNYYSTRPYEHYITYGIYERRLPSPNISNLYFPIYGSSVNFNSRLNFLQTVDNTLKIIPASENNLTVTYNLKFLLTDNLAGCLLKTIEIAGATKPLTFADPSKLYYNFTGLVEKYSINKISYNLSEFNIVLSNYSSAPQFFNSLLTKRYTSISIKDLQQLQNSSSLEKHSIFVTDISYDGNNNLTTLPTYNYYNSNWNSVTYPLSNRKDSSIYLYAKDKTNLTRNFYFETKYPFVLENEIDVYRMDFKNSFVQNIKYKQNSNTLKQFSLRFENISTAECSTLLFFLEEKWGYRRFVYEFPIFMKKNKVFICNSWNHTFKYNDCHDVTLQLIEDPNPVIIYPSSTSAVSFMNEPTLPF